LAGIAIAMPRLGMTMEEGTVVAWPTAPGGAVERGDIVLVIETEKAETEIEATASGVFRHIYVEPGETVPCGSLLAALTEAPDDAFDADAFAQAYVLPDGPAASPATTPVPPAAGGATRTPARSSPTTSRKPVAPAARALARELGVDVARIPGSGPNGRVTRADVEAFAAAAQNRVEVEEGVALEVLREGSGDAVVLLPGFGTDVSSFALLTPQLVDRFEAIGVNPRGVGASDAPDSELYEVGRAAEDVAAVLDGSAHVVGASLGAATALELALRHPEKVRSLTLITPFVEARPRLLAVIGAWVRAAGESSSDTLAALLAPWLFGEGLLGDAGARERTLRGLAQSLPRVPAVTLERAAAGLAAWSGSRTAELPDVGMPTLVLSAGADLLTPDGEGIAQAIPGARHAIVPGCGHALAIEGAAAVGEMLLAHIDAH
jgi:pimeloyl-ACP methyl ester carboxylesterase